MGFFSGIFNSPSIHKRLVGDWFSDLTDDKTANEVGDVKLTFDNGNRLTYLIRALDKSQVINMTYSIKGNIIITDQPSNPHKEETEFHFVGDDILVLKFSGVETRFKR